MDEYNKNNNDNTNGNEQPKTPFQTPVRDADSSGSQSSGNAGNGGGTYGSNPYRNGSQNTGNTSGAQNNNPYGNNSGSYNSGSSYNSSNPYSGSNQSAGNNNKYSGWGPSPSGNGGQRPKKPKKNGGKVPQKVIAAIAIAVIAFAGGSAVGSTVSRFQEPNAQTSATANTDDKTASGTPDSAANNGSAKMQISNSAAAGAGEAAANGQTSTDIYKNVSPSIVSIVVDDITLGSEASGSGVIMNKEGYIITNQHVVADGNKYTVILSDSKQYQAELVGADEQTDLAVLKIEPKKDLPAAEFGDSGKLQVGDRCYAIGSPGGVEFQNTFTGGFISAIDRDVTINDRVMTLIQTDTAINPGSSGGALINSAGQVIGITNSKLSSSSDASFEGMGFAIPTSTVQDIVDQLIANGKVTGRPAIGISGYDISETAAQYYDVPQGVLISSVNKDSDAYKQGLQANDIITAVDGKSITSMSDINAIKEKHKAGDSITLTIYRSGKTKTYKITLMDESDLDSTNSTANDSSGNNGNYGYGYYYGNGNRNRGGFGNDSSNFYGFGY